MSAQGQDCFLVRWVQEEKRGGSGDQEDCSRGDSEGHGWAQDDVAFEDCEERDDQIAGGEADGRHGADEPEKEEDLDQADQRGDGEQGGEGGLVQDKGVVESAAGEQEGGGWKADEGGCSGRGDVVQQTEEPDG